MNNIKVAYFSAEIGINDEIKTYSGGLGILAGDTIKAMADLKVPFCAVTLLYKKGYFKQKINHDNMQIELDDVWDYKKLLIDTKKEVKVNISGKDIKIKIFKYDYVGVTGHIVPIYFLDTKVEGNSEDAIALTEYLYNGDRISQEIVLGIGGFRALEELGIKPRKYHMNEGHSAFLTLELYKHLGQSVGWDDGQVRDRCVFTTHTPIPAGHDRFTYEVFGEKLRGEKDIVPLHIRRMAGDDELNTTHLALSYSGYNNAVSRKHGEVTREMFPDYTIDHITNGIHTATWLSPYMSTLFDKEIPKWREDFTLLKKANNIEGKKIYDAHERAKKDLIKYVNKNKSGDFNFKEDVLTIGFARRFIAYKDAELIFKNLNNLKRIGKKVQFIFAGKAHKKDGIGKDIIRRVNEYASMLDGEVEVAFLENYNIEIAKKLIAGCDLWLNTPIPFNEASGTSGMKAAANGCMHFSRLDGWAIEAFEMDGGGFPISHYADLMATLEYKIIPMYYNENKTEWICEMKKSICNSGAYFNTHRMAREYVKKSYKLNGF